MNITMAEPIATAEHWDRIKAIRALMEQNGVDVVVLGPTSNLRYFTGVAWSASERFTGAVIGHNEFYYVCPTFERDRLEKRMLVHGEIRTWQEDESAYEKIMDRHFPAARYAFDSQAGTFAYFGLCSALRRHSLVDAGPLINLLRRQKSRTEIALMKRANTITWQAHKTAWEQMCAGVRPSEVRRLIHQKHVEYGADNGSAFCLVSFGEDTALPHGGDGDAPLVSGDVVMIDTGCRVGGYHSDITRTYVFGEPTKTIAEIWAIEKAAQLAAFGAAKIDAACGSVDAAARDLITRAGLGPDYELPGVPHRTGHGIGLDLHESPNLVRGDRTLLARGMCFSNEPTIVVPGKFGVRLEDEICMTELGPEWLSTPSLAIDEPFGI